MNASILLTVNTGSSSIRISAFSMDAKRTSLITSSHVERAGREPDSLLRGFIDDSKIRAVGAIAHRVVHGGPNLVRSCIVDDEIEREIDRLSALAPLHNPEALLWVRSCRHLFGVEIPQVAVFDTAFFSALPPVAQTYALPLDMCKRHGIRRFGFHGLAHQAMWQRWRELRPNLSNGGRVISLQLGSGCSIAAIDQGKPKDTSMGFSPLEGLVMATRCGDVDPGLLLFLQGAEGLDSHAMDRVLNHESGLLGMTGHSDLRSLIESPDGEARLAVELYCYRARKYVGAYLAALGSADGLVLGGGVGEHLPAVRHRILAGMEWLGISLDAEANAGAIGREARISGAESRVEVWVIPVDEAAILANEAVAVLASLDPVS